MASAVTVTARAVAATNMGAPADAFSCQQAEAALVRADFGAAPAVALVTAILPTGRHW